MQKLPIHHQLLDMADDVYEEGAYEVALLMRAAANELIRLRTEMKAAANTTNVTVDTNRKLRIEIAALQGQLAELQGQAKNTSQH